MYIKSVGGTTSFYSIAQLKKDNPKVSFPSEIPARILAIYYVYDAEVLPVPAYDSATQRPERVITGSGVNYQVDHNIVQKSDEECKRNLTQAVQDHLDDAASAKGYDGILSACTYAASNGRFRAEGIASINWRDDVWDVCITALEDVESGARTMPTSAQLISELPAIAW